MLILQNVQKKYPGFTLNADLQVRPGSITGLIGQNGAGKSTLFKTVLGLVHPDGGEIRILGKPQKDFTDQDRQQLGVVLADSGFSGYLTVSDVRAILKQMYPAFNENAFRANCQKFGLKENQQIREFSTGMKAKLKVLSVLSHGAKLLILDEPTAGLDVIARDDILDLLREYMEEDEDRAVLISSHISTDLETLCDDFYMIHEGEIILHEETDRLLSDYAVIKLSEEDYAGISRQHLLKIRKEAYGFSCLTDSRQFYLENYPDITVEKSGIDELIQMMIKGRNL